MNYKKLASHIALTAAAVSQLQGCKAGGEKGSEICEEVTVTINERIHVISDCSSTSGIRDGRIDKVFMYEGSRMPIINARPMKIFLNPYTDAEKMRDLDTFHKPSLGTVEMGLYEMEAFQRLFNGALSYANHQEDILKNERN